MSAGSDVLVVRTSEEVRPRALRRLRELWDYREILVNLVRKEVKVKYASSVLGAAWSMLNPILYLAVFSLVFTVVLNNHIPYFAIYLLSGLLAWNLFATSMTLSVRSVVENANLVKKVWMPREVLPLSTIGVSLVDFVLQALVLAAFMLALRYGVVGANLLLLPLSFVALLLFTSALSLWISALNVRYRDTQHLLNLALLTWFWLTPVVYPSGFLQNHLERHAHWLFTLYLANPLADIVFGFQRAIYGVIHPAGAPQILVDGSVGWLAGLLGAVIGGSLVLLYLFWRTFFRLSGDFAEEL